MLQNRFDNIIKSILITKITEATSFGVALAISGGCDSMALLHLASNWAKRYNICLTIFTVNHGLRKKAFKEIEFVKEITLSLGHGFYEFLWESGSVKSAIQEKARLARYNMMTKKCHDLGINILLTAHHLDDMLETYLMRLRKKSSILGLSHSESFFYNNIWIFRPLVGFFKVELVDYLQGKKAENIQNFGNINWIEDESNKSDDYERNRIRKQISTKTIEQKNQLISELKSANIAAYILNEQLVDIMAQTVSVNNFGFATVDLNKIRQVPLDVKIYVISYLLTIISGKTFLPRFRSLIHIIDNINKKKLVNCSLHGCLLKEHKNYLLILREKDQISKTQTMLGKLTYWDERFTIEWCNADISKRKYYITRLELADYVRLKDQLDYKSLKSFVDNNHNLILFTLPVIKNLEKIVAIPHISYYDDKELIESLNVIFRPNFISRFTHFL